MCYSSSKDFGWDARKETRRRPEERPETHETPKPAKAPEFTFWAFPKWRRSPVPGTPSAERSKERV
ncbi:hypothetical protein DC347_00690 [Pseudarthrobacter sp. AG30]|nr:hypothetical protein DC347_00690 [Pseudarthrobacter sp. AG30]TDT81771.1 hypothetical protein DFO47_103429 [Arthrobacter sp. AG258]